MMLWSESYVLHFSSKGCSLVLRSLGSLLLHPSTQVLYFPRLKTSLYSSSVNFDLLSYCTGDFRLPIKTPSVSVEFVLAAINSDGLYVINEENKEAEEQKFEHEEITKAQNLNHKGKVSLNFSFKIYFHVKN